MGHVGIVVDDLAAGAAIGTRRRTLRENSTPGRLRAWADLYVSVLVVYEVNNLLAGVDMTKRVVGAWMHEKMD